MRGHEFNQGAAADAGAVEGGQAAADVVVHTGGNQGIDHMDDSQQGAIATEKRVQGGREGAAAAAATAAAARRGVFEVGGFFIDMGTDALVNVEVCVCVCVCLSVPTCLSRWLSV